MKTIFLFLTLSLLYVASSAQTSGDHDEFLYNRRLARNTESVIPKNGFVPDKVTAIAIACAVSVPIYGKKEIDGEKPLRAELDDGVWTVLGTLHCESCQAGHLSCRSIGQQEGSFS